jgi:2-keto-myo-inositol isomerase
MKTKTRFALNHMVAPNLPVQEFFRLTREAGISCVEIRNDLPGVAIADGTPPAETQAKAATEGITILSINALQRFNEWNTTREMEAISLARYAQECGAPALVLCPVCDHSDRRSEGQRLEDLQASLRALAPILRERGVIGLVEPLGFAESSLRSKRQAVEAITAVGEERTFQLLHDTFHHHVAGEPQVFPEWTGLVHISGVEDRQVSELRDVYRVLVGPTDIVGNVAQIDALRSGGYDGYFSFEPFAESVQGKNNIAAALPASLAYLEKEGFSVER